MQAGHIPVMLHEVLEELQPKKDGVYVDGTFGAGGYTRAILNAADCIVYAIDRDPDAMIRAQHMAKEFPNRLFPLHGRFGNLADLLKAANIELIDGLVLDIGVSSIQLSEAARGFSFQNDGPLDMRMEKSGLSAADVVNDTSESELADIIYNFGEERASRRIAKKIVTTRTQAPIKTTRQLAEIVHSVLPQHPGLKTDTATRTFQALRIYVNDELGELTRALDAAEKLLVPEGRLVVVSFHSLEDGIVKHFLKMRSGKGGNVSRHLPEVKPVFLPTFQQMHAGRIKASSAETTANPRARSATLRSGIRTSSPPWQEEVRHA